MKILADRVFVYRAALRRDILAHEVANPATLQKIRNAMSYNVDEVIHLNTLYGGRYEERTANTAEPNDAMSKTRFTFSTSANAADTALAITICKRCGRQFW